MLFRALIWRPLRNDLGRTLLSLLAIALGVAVVIAIRVANRSAIGSFQRTTSALAGGADLLATGPAAVPASLLPRLTGLNAQAEFSPYLDRWAYDPAHHDTLEVLGLDLLASAGASSQPVAATLPWILVPPDYAGLHQLRSGDRIELVAAGTPRQFRIAGVLPGNGAAAAASAAVMDLPDALAAFEPGTAPPAFDGLRVRLAPGVEAAVVAAALRPLLLVLSTVWKFGSPWAMGLVLGLTGWGGLARSVRAQTLSLRERGFVEAARGLGFSTLHVIVKELLPNM
ncbi:MAG: ABC transporter permease subunit, partial [Terriglobales bacterium]